MQSSAKSLQVDDILATGYMIRNINEPKTVPCGTPEYTLTSLDDSPSMITSSQPSIDPFME